MSRGNDYNVKDIRLHGITDPRNIKKMAPYCLERIRNNRIISHLGHRRLMCLEAGDLVRLSYPALGWENKWLRVESVRLTENGPVLAYSEEDDSFYNDTYEPAITTPSYFTRLSSFADPPPVIETNSVSFREKTYRIGIREEALGLEIIINPPEDYPWWGHAEVWQKKDSEWYLAGLAANSFFIPVVYEGDTYMFRFVAVSESGQKGQHSATFTYKVGRAPLIIPKVASNITTLVRDDTITITGRDDEQDYDLVDGYEIRAGHSWETGKTIGFVSRPWWQFSGFRPGNHTLFVAARSKMNVYSGVEAVNVVVASRFGEEMIKTEYVTFDEKDSKQTFENTYADKNGVLMCKDGATHGTWKGKYALDLSPKRIFIWAIPDMIIHSTADAKTWAAILGEQGWSFITGRNSWLEILGLQYGHLDMTLRWRKESGDVDHVTDNFDIFSFEIETREIEIEIRIKDPSHATSKSAIGSFHYNYVERPS